MVAAATAPFRFSRMGPNGKDRQLGEANRRKIGNEMAAGGGGVSRWGRRLRSRVSPRRTASTCRAARAARRRRSARRSSRITGMTRTWRLPRRTSPHPLPQPRGRHPAGLGAAVAALCAGERARHQALSVDDPDGLPAARLRPGRDQQRLQPGAEGVRGGVPATDVPTMPIESRWPRFDSGTRWSAGPTTGTRSSTTAPGRSSCCFGSRRPAGASTASSCSRAPGSRTSAASTTSRRRTSRASRCPRAGSTARCASTPRSSTR